MLRSIGEQSGESVESAVSKLWEDSVVNEDESVCGSGEVACRYHCCINLSAHIDIIIIIIIIITITMTKVIARVHPVHLTNVD